MYLLPREMLVNAFPLGNVIIQIDGICDCDCGGNVSTCIM